MKEDYKNKSLNFGKAILVILSTCSLILFLSISFYRWKCADDFLFLKEFEDKSVLEISIEKYLHWDAKFLMPFFIVWLTMLKFLGFKILLPIASISFILCSYFIIKIIKTQCTLSYSKSDIFILIAVLNLFFFLSLYNIHSYTLYWLAGSVYIHAMLLALIWLFIYLRNNKEKKRSSLFFYLFTFFISTSLQNITLGLFVLVIIDLYSEYFIAGFDSHPFNSKRDKLILFFCFLIGIVVSTISPGSLNQYSLMHGSNYSEYVDHEFAEYIKHFFELNLDAIKTNGIHLLIFAFSFVIILFYFSKSQILQFKFFNFHKKEPFFYYIYKLRWFIMSFCTLMIYWPTLLIGGRYYIGLYFYLFIALVFIIIDRTEIIKNTKSSAFYLFIVFLVLNYGIYMYLHTLRDNYLAYKFINQREEYLSNNKGANRIYLEILDFSTFTRTSRSPEISNNPNYYVNQNYSTYYCVDTIIGKEVITKSDLIQRYLGD